MRLLRSQDDDKAYREAGNIVAMAPLKRKVAVAYNATAFKQRVAMKYLDLDAATKAALGTVPTEVVMRKGAARGAVTTMPAALFRDKVISSPAFMKDNAAGRQQRRSEMKA